MYSIFKCSPLFLQGFIYDNGDYLSVLVDSYNKYDLMENYRVLENLPGITQINNDYQLTLLLFDNETAHDFTNLIDGDPYSPYEFEEGYYEPGGVVMAFTDLMHYLYREVDRMNQIIEKRSGKIVSLLQKHMEEAA